jgi:hypothetical protein
MRGRENQFNVADCSKYAMFAICDGDVMIRDRELAGNKKLVYCSRRFVISVFIITRVHCIQIQITPVEEAP